MFGAESFICNTLSCMNIIEKIKSDVNPKKVSGKFCEVRGRWGHKKFTFLP